MGRAKGVKNKIQSGITYPRKCEHCDYTSNNPSMYHYHKQTHDPIPVGQLCEHGCTTLALFRGTGGKYTCLKNAFQCPAYLQRHAESVTEQWQAAGSDNRRLASTATLATHCWTPASTEKQKATLQKKFGNFTPEQMKDFRHYARRIRARAQKWAKAQGHVIGLHTFHVDHKLSIADAWRAGLPEGIVNHPVNLEILSAKLNSSKGSKSSLTIAELIQAIINGA
jgi:hypothetical protein